MFSRDYSLDAGVKMILSVALRRIFHVGGKDDEMEKR